MARETEPAPYLVSTVRALGLRWADVDWSERTLTRSWSLRIASMGPTKSRRPRTVPVGREVLARLREAFARVVGAAKLAGEPTPTIRTMRHSTATWWLAAGLTVHEVADLLGHANPTLVIRRYGHALPRQRATAGTAWSGFRARG